MLVHCVHGRAYGCPCIPMQGMFAPLSYNVVCMFLLVCLQPSLLSVVAGGTKGVTRTNRSHSDLVDRSDGKSNRCVGGWRKHAVIFIPP